MYGEQLSDLELHAGFHRRFPKPPEPEPFKLIAMDVRLLVDGTHGAEGEVVELEPQLAEQLVRDGLAVVFCDKESPHATA